MPELLNLLPDVFLRTLISLLKVVIGSKFPNVLHLIFDSFPNHPNHDVETAEDHEEKCVKC